MSQSQEPQREHPSTYFVQDRSNQNEMLRVRIQDQLITAGMGGPLSDQPDPESFQRVLDVGCGTGNWLITLAKMYPHLSRLDGIDVSKIMIVDARVQAEEAGVAERVHFQVMDALRMLEFPPGSFDLANLRFGMSYLRTWDWPRLLQDFRRVTCLDGIIRITESEMLIQSTSPALTRLYTIALDAAYKAGHFFTPESDGVTSQLAHLLSQGGLQDVQTRTHTLIYRVGTPEMTQFYENMSRVFRTAEPFYRKWTRVPEDYNEIYQQALVEMQQPDFVATWNLLTAWGRNDDVV